MASSSASKRRHTRGIRLFELSRKANVQHVIYSGLDYASRDSGFDPSLYVGHYEGKARVQRKRIIPCTAQQFQIARFGSVRS